MITTCPAKADDTCKFGAHDVLISTGKAALRVARGRFDPVLDPVPVAHEAVAYLLLLAASGILVMVGASDPEPVPGGVLIAGRQGGRLDVEAI